MQNYQTFLTTSKLFRLIHAAPYTWCTVWVRLLVYLWQCNSTTYVITCACHDYSWYICRQKKNLKSERKKRKRRKKLKQPCDCHQQTVVLSANCWFHRILKLFLQHKDWDSEVFTSCCDVACFEARLGRMMLCWNLHVLFTFQS